MIKSKTTRAPLNLRSIIFSSIFWVVFFIIGLMVIILFGGQLSKTANWSSADSIISRISDQTTYVDYDATNSLGITSHYVNIRLNEYSSNWTVGTTVPIKYDPANPEQITSATAFSTSIPYIAGGIFVAIGFIGEASLLIKAAKESKASKKILSSVDVEKGIDYSLNGNIPDPIETVSNNTTSVNNIVADQEDGTKSYMMEPSSSLNHRFNYIVTDIYGREIVESKKINHFPFTSAHVAFFSHITKKTETHAFSTYLTSYRSTELDALPASMTFQLDGQKVWRLLFEQGYRIVPNTSLFSFEIYKDKEKIGTINKEVPIGLNGGFDAKKIADYYKSQGKYQIMCKEKDIDDVFLISLCLANLSSHNSR